MGGGPRPLPSLLPAVAFAAVRLSLPCQLLLLQINKRCKQLQQQNDDCKEKRMKRDRVKPAPQSSSPEASS